MLQRPDALVRVRVRVRGLGSVMVRGLGSNLGSNRNPNPTQGLLVHEKTLPRRKDSTLTLGALGSPAHVQSTRRIVAECQCPPPSSSGAVSVAVEQAQDSRERR
eukprot:scaffold145243_cov99-Phaeocystis_antarctica.AAC.1